MGVFLAARLTAGNLFEVTILLVVSDNLHTVRRAVNSLSAALFASAWVLVLCYAGGSRLAFSLPGYTLIGLAALAAAAAIPSARGRWTRACSVVTAIVFSYVLARAFTSPVEYLARRDVAMVLACLAVYAITVRAAASRSLRVAIVIVFFIAAVMQMILGAHQFSQGHDWMPFGLVRKPLGGQMDFRASGTFISSIHFGGFLEAVGPFALAFVFWGSRTLWPRMMALLVAASCYFGIAITGSRGAWVSAAISLGVFSALSLDLIRRTNRARLPAAVYLTILGLLCVPTAIWMAMERSEHLSQRMKLLGKVTQHAGVKAGEAGPATVYDVRIYNWAAALRQWKLSPWLGTGAGTHLYYGRMFRHPALQSDPEHAHSDYLEMLAEYGIIGLAGLMFFIIVHIFSGVHGYLNLARERAEDPYRPSLELASTVGALTALSAYLAHSAVDFNLHIPANALLFAFLFGILANPSPWTLDDPCNEVGKIAPAPPPRLVFMGLGAALLFFTIRWLPAEFGTEKGRIAIRDGSFEKAISLLQKTSTTETSNPFLYYHLGQAHRLNARGKPVAAGRDDLLAATIAFRQSLALFPLNQDAWVRLGQTLDALGEYPEARKAYERAIQIDPNLGLLYAYLAKHLQRCGRDEEAEHARLKGQSLTPLNLTYVIQELSDDGEVTPFVTK